MSYGLAAAFAVIALGWVWLGIRRVADSVLTDYAYTDGPAASEFWTASAEVVIGCLHGVLAFFHMQQGVA